MERNDSGLERICKIYLNLNDDDKEKIIKLGEGLLKSQKIITEENFVSDTEESTDWLSYEKFSYEIFNIIFWRIVWVKKLNCFLKNYRFVN